MLFKYTVEINPSNDRSCHGCKYLFEQGNAYRCRIFTAQIPVIVGNVSEGRTRRYVDCLQAQNEKPK